MGTSTPGTSVFGGDLVISGAVAVDNSASFYQGLVAIAPGDSIASLTASRAGEFASIGIKHGNLIASRNKLGTAWTTMMGLLDVPSLGSNNLVFGDLGGAFLHGVSNTKAIYFYTSASNGTITSPQAVFDPITGSYFSGSMHFVSGGLRVGSGIMPDPGTGNVLLPNFGYIYGKSAIVPNNNIQLIILDDSDILHVGQYFLNGVDTVSIEAVSASATIINGNTSMMVKNGVAVGLTASDPGTGNLLVVGYISGSHQTLANGTPAFVAGPNITIANMANGAVAISGSAGGSAGTQRASLASIGTSTQVSSAYQVMGRFYYDPTEWTVAAKSIYWKAVFASSDNSTPVYVSFYNATTGSYVAINAGSRLAMSSSTPAIFSGSHSAAVVGFDPAVAALLEVHAMVSSSATVNQFSMAELVVK